MLTGKIWLDFGEILIAAGFSKQNPGIAAGT